MRSNSPTLQDVARRSGVSARAVSLVINGTSNKTRTRVSDATRQRILEAARELDYHPNIAARSLRQRRIQMIGVLFGRVSSAVVSNPYASGVLQGVLAAASEADYDVALSSKKWEDAESSAPRFRDGRVDGLIVVQPFTDGDMVPGLVERGLPVVVVSWREGLTPAVPSVDVDNAAGIRMAVRHLVALGHRRIAHIAGEANYASAYLRRQAFAEAMAEAGLPVPDGYIVQGSYRGGSAREAIEQVLSHPVRPTALVGANDGVAAAAMRAAQERGWRVPDDFSVVGFNDTSLAPYLQPPLTTLHEPLPEMGETALRLLVRVLEGEEVPTTPVRIPPRLVVRGSTAPPN
jgi:DNA-binding LacI/PurR family transcriptional regulator